jgi:hypothetical protein
LSAKQQPGGPNKERDHQRGKPEKQLKTSEPLDGI